MTGLGKALAACLLFWVAVVGFILFCTRCSGAECGLAWDHPPYHERVVRWELFVGIERVATVFEPTATIDLPADRTSTVTVYAVNETNTSEPATITVVPLTPRHSEDLKTWTTHPRHAFFVEYKPRMFANFSFPTQ